MSDIIFDNNESIELTVLDQDEDITLDIIEPDEVDLDFDIVTVTTSDHTELTGRDAPNQHPVSAITGLEEALDGLEGDIGDLETELGTKQDTLVSGVNIKTVDNQSVVGSGNLDTAPGWDNVQSKPNFAAVATTGDYDDLTDKFYFAVNQSEGLVITKF